MDIEIAVSCHRCTGKFWMGKDTHNCEYREDKHMVGGLCPWCGAYVTQMLYQDRIEQYPKTRPENTTVLEYYPGG